MSPPAWSTARRALLDALVDRIVPASADGKLPAARAHGVGDFLERRVDDTPGLAGLLDAGLAAAETLLGERTSAAPAEAAAEHLDAVLFTLASSQPAFVEALVRQTYMGFYTHPAALVRFGLPERPPHPLGHEQPANEGLDALVEPVLRRGRRYREC